ncbi:hypothetical protein Tco_0485017 [Tanacetum coccineum]
MEIIPKMASKIDSLEKELKETKQTLGKAVLTLVKKMKSLEVALKRQIENQGRNNQDIDDDPIVSLVRDYMEEKAADFVTPIKVTSHRARSTNKGKRYKRRTRPTDGEHDIKGKLNFADVEVNTGRVEINPGCVEVNPGHTGVNTGSTPISTPSVVQTVNVIIPSPINVQREGKAPMTTKDVQATQKTKEQLRQKEVGLAEAMRLQALQDEEVERQVYLDALLVKRIQEEQELSEQQQKRKAEVPEAAQHFTKED